MLAKPWARLLNHRAEVGMIATFGLATIAVVFASYHRLFSSFASYDDEGYVMVSLCRFMAGGALYDEVYSQYGPAYYWLTSLLHWTTDWPVTHDVTRLKTLVVWASTSLCAAAWLYRVTRSAVLSLIGLLFISFHLERLAMEPGHPQELCLLAVAVCLLLATFLRTKSSHVPVLIVMGIAIALCLMTKINVGVFLLISISASMLFTTQMGRLRTVLLGGIALAMIALPLVIGRHELFTVDGYRLPHLLTFSIGLALWVCRHVEMERIFDLRHLAIFWASVVLACAGLAAGTVAAGTSWHGLVDGLLLQHLSFVSQHYHAPPIHIYAPLAAILATFLVTDALKQQKLVRVVYPIALVLIAGATLRHLVETFQPLYHGSQDRGQVGLLVSYFAPLLWIILLPVRDRQAEPHASARSPQFARLTLCLVAVLQPLIAHPVPGTQMAIGSLALVLAMLTALHDFVEMMRRDQHAFLPAARGVTLGLLVLLAGSLLARDVMLWSGRSRLSSLALRGASRLRLPDEIVATERWTVEQLRLRADTFLCLPSGHNSLYLWSGIEPPTGFNATVWQDLLDDERQLEIIAAIASRRRVCVVVDHHEPASLQTPGPLVAYLRENFEPVATRGAREIWQRQSSGPSARVVIANHSP